MAEASPIGRGKNLTMETLLSFIYAIPTEPQPKNKFLEYGEQRMKGWRQTHSQIARQLALYYEDANGICHPRFVGRVTPEIVMEYVWNWAHKYYAPNPFTPSLEEYIGKETNIYAYIKAEIKKGHHVFSQICNSIFGIELNNIDKVRVYLTNFTDLVINDDYVDINTAIKDEIEYEINPIIENTSPETYFNHFSITIPIEKKVNRSLLSHPLQQIFFGAPGTGKSHKINEVCAEYENYRTTFHPDTDYASFVGSYKPITEVVKKFDQHGNPYDEKRIVYTYVFQSFLKAYIAAWKEQQNPEPKPVFLVVEEINRGNCAQIFGDIFQLLDRNESGYSDYPIVADDDLAQELKREFENLNVANYEAINSLYLGDKDVVGSVKKGELLLLPNNLYIWATMNTSDQSLFPIDSAFKRRWDWKYIKIKKSDNNYKIVFSNGHEYDWWEFIKAINEHIEGGDIQQEDKKLGYFFAKAKNGIISAERFLSKVIFYLYNDVFKDFGLEEDIFKDEDGKTMTFASYFNEYGEVEEDRVERFIKNLQLNPNDSKTKDSESNNDIIEESVE